MKFVQIATGDYTYNKKTLEEAISHSIYALDVEGKVWKFIPKKKVWIRLEDIDFD